MEDRDLVLLNAEADGQLISSIEFENAYISLVNEIEALTSLRKRVDEQVKNKMAEEYHTTGNTKVVFDTFQLVYVPESYRETCDSKALKEAEPEIYKKFTKVTHVSDAVRVVKSKNKEA